MSNKEHILGFTSRRIYFIRGFLAIALGLLITLLIVTSIKAHFNEIAFLGIDAFFTVLLFYLSRNWHKGQLTVSLKEKEITVSSYLPILKRSRQYNFSWEDITDLSFSDTQYFKILIVKTNRERVAVAINYGDEATQLEQLLNKKISKLDQDGVVAIHKKQSIYETKTGIFLAAILVLLMIGWPIAAWLNGKDFKIGLAVIFYSGASFFIYMVFQSHKRKNASQ